MTSGNISSHLQNTWKGVVQQRSCSEKFHNIYKKQLRWNAFLRHMSFMIFSRTNFEATKPTRATTSGLLSF